MSSRLARFSLPVATDARSPEDREREDAPASTLDFGVATDARSIEDRERSTVGPPRRRKRGSRWMRDRLRIARGRSRVRAEPDLVGPETEARSIEDREWC